MQTFQIEPFNELKNQFTQLLNKIRATKGKKPTLEEITAEVEAVRASKKSIKANHPNHYQIH